MGGFNNTWNVGWVAVGTFVDTDTMQFGLKFSDILDIIGKERKVSYIMGGFSLDLWKCDETVLFNVVFERQFITLY